MFKKVKKVVKVFAVISILIGILVLPYKVTIDTTEEILLMSSAVTIVALFLISLTFVSSFSKGAKERTENLECARNFLSGEEFKKVNLVAQDNNFMQISLNESSISYYARMKLNSDNEVEISIRKNGVEISKEVIELSEFTNFFTN